MAMFNIGAHRGLACVAALAGLALGASALGGVGGDQFRRIASFPVFLNTDISEQTVAEICASSPDGNTVVYTDSAGENIGFVDITDPANPQPLGTVALAGEPTSVAVVGNLALAGVNTSADFVNTSGDLVVIDMDTMAIVETIALGGQPDAVAISPDGTFAAIAIENERDEDLGNGEPPQLPAGFLVTIDITGDPSTWTPNTIALTGLADLFPEDPEPEFVDINGLNQAVVTMQENNYIVIVDLATSAIVNHFSCGTVDLTDVDTNENDLIEQDASLAGVPREPDAVAWVSDTAFATADEGDLFGGSRGFTVFSTDGSTLFESGNFLEHLTARHGHYPEGRSENKGCEPEGIEFGVYGGEAYLFVGSERSSVVAVYKLTMSEGAGGGVSAEYIQVLPTTVGPEGLHAIPSRDLFVVSCEEDDRDIKVRSTLTVFQRGLEPNYPTVVSEDLNEAGVPIPWAALSGLVTDPGNDDVAYTVYDSFYQQSRFFSMDVSTTPAVITGQFPISDASGLLIDALDDLKANLPGADDFVPSDLVNVDGTVNIDPEGVSAMSNGNLWIASEGAGNLDAGVSDPEDRPFESPNLLLRVSASGDIEHVAMPPVELTMNQLRFGFEGVAVDESAGYVYVAFQRAWTAAGDASGQEARIGRYEPSTGEWAFAYYPLDGVESGFGGWVGLSEITFAPTGNLVVLERDNQGGPDAAVKRVYEFNPATVTFVPTGGAINTITKSLVRDLMAEGDFAQTGGLVPEKLEGLAINSAGDVFIVNDNDGVDDNSGETQLLRFGGLVGACGGDFNGDGVTDTLDLNTVLVGFGDAFDSDDLNAVLGNFGCN